MKGLITSFRRGRKTQTMNQVIIQPEGSENLESAEKVVGKDVVFTTLGGRELKGKIRATHGIKGCVRALFETGMPGQSIGKPVEIN
ncbi:50S ribosomal protein L35ae [Candidatus Woesearchaeota archaeon]|jgi:large subunit ribosomal protein L35Ae|nr:50S ribosomal protein L35ae [Candidatus Woesearchaeota archaeon]